MEKGPFPNPSHTVLCMLSTADPPPWSGGWVASFRPAQGHIPILSLTPTWTPGVWTFMGSDSKGQPTVGRSLAFPYVPDPIVGWSGPVGIHYLG